VLQETLFNKKSSNITGREKALVFSVKKEVKHEREKYNKNISCTRINFLSMLKLELT